MTKITKVEKAQQVNPVLTQEQAQRIQAILERDGEPITPLRALTATAAVARLKEATHIERLKQEREEKEIAR